ncbi:uncharacterized protein LOC119075248 [Bradysia coprophila]|uniref:uncharacterized protein LOC119075248 n=1 Tax=Bradysia coprophila TaxID=38358 RepID=UPI00187D7F06|nr:uncharacterized protein LOC119075248 [Bradysia coprophila]
MKHYALSCLILMSIQATPIHSLPNPINKILLEKIEDIRSRMPCGINGGPGLVPFREQFVDVTYNNSTNIGIDGFLQDLLIDNLNSFVVDKIDFSLLRLKLDFGFTLPHTLIQGQYNITGQYSSRIKIWGSGPFSVELNDLQLSGSLLLRIHQGYLDMTQLQTLLALNSLSSNIAGILGSDEASFVFNKMIEELLPKMLDTYSTDIGQMISEYLRPIANQHLHKLTLSDIIGGGGTDKPPCDV